MISRVDSVHELRVWEIMAELPDTDPDKPDEEWFREAVKSLHGLEKKIVGRRRR